MTFDGIDRRALMQRALLLVGAAALPGGTEALAAVAKSAKPKPKLDAAHFALLSAVSDTIVPKTDTPGALEAGVPKLVDEVVANWATPQHRAEMIAALDKIDSLAREEHQRGFAALTAEQRTAVLTPHDIQALKAPPKPATPPVAPQIDKAPTKIDPKVGRAKQEPAGGITSMMSPRFADPGYGKLKELIVMLFYCTETALTHELAYEHNPGVWQPSMPITPTTRPWGGNALI